MIASLLARFELSAVRVFETGIEPENVASMHCLTAAGFQQNHRDPDFEGMLYFLHVRIRPRPSGL
jgi:hypothetical protein